MSSNILLIDYSHDQAVPLPTLIHTHPKTNLRRSIGALPLMLCICSIRTQENSTVRVTEQWHRLPREMLESPLLEIVKRPRHSPQKSAIGNLP